MSIQEQEIIIKKKRGPVPGNPRKKQVCKSDKLLDKIGESLYADYKANLTRTEMLIKYKDYNLSLYMINTLIKRYKQEKKERQQEEK